MPRKCIETECNKSPIYNYPDNSSRIYCRQHAKEGMRVVGQQYCQGSECEKYALYNYQGETKKLYCQEHAKIGMVNVKRHTCVYKNCPTQPYYNYPTETVGKYCAKHALPKMINVYAKKCKKCSHIPSFNFRGEKYGEYCKEHALDGMVNVRTNLCSHKDCLVQASFNHVGTHTPIFCGKHKLDKMINLRKKTCVFYGCKKSALFNNGEQGVGYCAEHKDDDMISRQRKICKHPECSIIPNFGINNAEYCSEHKKPSMKRIIARYPCKYNGCEKCASFNFGGLKPLYCALHRETGMRNVSVKQCIKKNCSFAAHFGYPGNSPQFCSLHHPVGTILKPNKRCIIKNCNELALFGKKDHIHCENHKQDGDINFIERICKKCTLLTVVDENEICKYCNPGRWKVIRLAKQKEVQALFNREQLEYEFTDTIVENGECGKERPDFVFEGESHYIIVEVDEDQHKSRACECEQTRMVNISQSLGMPTIFLRYNPDRYNVGGKCQDTTKASRHKTLIKWLTDLMVLDIEKLQEHGYLSVLHLYFDDFNPRKVQWETILEFEEE